MNTDRKPALEPGWCQECHGQSILVADLPPAILPLTAPELRALGVFAEAMPELRKWPHEMPGHIYDKFRAALAAAKEIP